MRFVKTSAAKRVPSRRPFTDAIDVASITHVRLPASSISRKSRCRSIDSGVFSPTVRVSVPTRRSTFVSRPGGVAGGFEDRPQQVRGRGLAVRASDRRHAKLGGGIAEELDRPVRHRGADARHHDLRDIDLQPAFDDERRGAASHCIGSEIVPVDGRARDAKEQGAARNLPCVVRQLADLDGSASNDVGRSERSDEPLQLHIAGQV